MNIPRFRLGLITGATSGIGHALASRLAEEGIPLLLTGRDEEKLREIAEEVRVPVETLALDLTSATQRQQLIERIHAAQPDLVINNAGFGLYGDALTHTTQDQLNMLDLNVQALVELSLEAARVLITAGKPGVILNVSSVTAFQVFPTLAVYAASKAFVYNFSRSFDLELRPYGVRCLVSCPGQVNTLFATRASGQRPLSDKAQWVMSSSFAAEQIWQQILHQRPAHIFDWRYRLGTFFSRLFPETWTGRLLRRSIEARYPLRAIIPPSPFTTSSS